MKRLLVFLILLIVVFPGVYAVGGGGGGSSSSSGGGSSSDSGSSSSSGNLLVFTVPKCFDSGQITFEKTKNLNKEVKAIGPSGESFKVDGNWAGNLFASDEVIFNDKGEYTIIVDDKNKTFNCPGFIFSCKIVAINIKECVNTENGTKAIFQLANADVNDLAFDFITTNKVQLKYFKSSFSSQLKNLKVKQATNGDYVIDIPPGEPMSLLQVSHPNCVGKYYIYSKITCVNKSLIPSPEEVGLKLKCGGYLDIEDRVKCRISLREEERKEYENFFPEECSTREDKDQCLGVYQNVQKCWSFPNGIKRINCVKEQLDLGAIDLEKSNCNKQESDQLRKCNKELERKVYDLVKFRLYNLEEEAEIFMNEGKLKNQDVVDFVVAMENIKASFNKAGNNTDKKDLIIKARKNWIALIRKIEIKQ